MTLAIGNIMKGWKIPPPPEREPDGWKNVYQRPDGSIWDGLCQVSARTSDFLAKGNGSSKRIYRLRIYLKKEPTRC